MLGCSGIYLHQRLFFFFFSVFFPVEETSERLDQLESLNFW